jgi:hypothetical protein
MATKAITVKTRVLLVGLPFPERTAYGSDLNKLISRK